MLGADGAILVGPGIPLGPGLGLGFGGSGAEGNPMGASSSALARGSQAAMVLPSSRASPAMMLVCTSLAIANDSLRVATVFMSPDIRPSKRNNAIPFMR